MCANAVSCISQTLKSENMGRARPTNAFQVNVAKKLAVVEFPWERESQVNMRMQEGCFGKNLGKKELRQGTNLEIDRTPQLPVLAR